MLSTVDPDISFHLCPWGGGSGRSGASGWVGKGSPLILDEVGASIASTPDTSLWNWLPAKIFMGDPGSLILGFTFAVMAIWSENTGALPLAVWGILLAVFLIDATFTVARRMKNREKWFEAHRSHAYQLAVQAGASHQKVTLGVVAINLVLGALAWIAWTWPVALLATLVGVVVVLGVPWLWIVKGNREILGEESETGAS